MMHDYAHLDALAAVSPGIVPQAEQSPAEPAAKDEQLDDMLSKLFGDEQELPGIEEPAPLTVGLSGLRKQNEDSKRMGELYMAQAERIRRAKGIPTAIIKGLQQGEDINSLFLKAVDCISLQTGDTVLPALCREALAAKYEKHEKSYE